MTFQAYTLLIKLKKVQVTESGSIWFDDDNKKMMTVIETQNAKKVSVDFSKKWHTLPSTLSYLQSCGFLEKYHADYCSLTHSSYYYTQTLISSLISFLIKSIGVSIATSILTTLISLKLFGVI